MKNWSSFEKELLKDKKIKAEYEKLEPEYRLIESLIQARLEKGLTQAALAQKIGTKQSAISRLERGMANPSLAFLKRLAEGLGCQISVQFET